MRGKVILTALALSLAAAAANAQDVVRLRSGKILSGAINVDDARSDGFSVTLWDTGGTVFVRWTQISETEKLRLTNRKALVTTAVLGDILDGVRIVTESREVVGVLVDERGINYVVKTAANPAPTQVPKSSVLKKEDLKIQETEAYSPEEMFARRDKPGLNAAQLIELGAFGRALKLYEKARDAFTKAGAADAARKDECDMLAAQCDMLIKEAAAEKALAAIRKLQEETKYDKAMEAAEKFVDDFADTELFKANKDLVAKLEAEAKDFAANRELRLTARVPDLWRTIRTAQLSKLTDRRNKVADVRASLQKIDVEIASEVSKKIGCTREEAEAFWGKREQKPTTVSMDAGSWIYLGGQDGGMDYTGTGAEGDEADDFVRRFGGKGKGGEPRKPPELGRKLETADEWWQRASATQRQRWVLCCYALQSQHVKRTEENEGKDCSHCRGVGTLQAARGGKMVDVICPRCHGCKKDKQVTFW